VTWLLRRLWPRTRRELLQRLIGLGVLVFLASVGMTWRNAVGTRASVTTAAPKDFGIPVPPGTQFRGERTAPFASAGRRTPAAAWSAVRDDLGLEYVAPWYRWQLTRPGWDLQIGESNVGDPNVERIVAHQREKKFTVEVRLARADARASRTRIIVLYHPDAGGNGAQAPVGP
jgi:hypothetical protein